ncbi:hypothetical protein [Bradyrhizobium sp. HKCCYLS20291]|uniref:hypothetical protein n=1 Tax=Bradyrhizobium sp. HKCCYLS20291 TaxID=3420766 RepID=UPI003EB7FB3A
MSITIGPPHLFGSELSLLEDVFRRDYRRYFEFGLGGSTLMAVRHGFDSIVAVDSDPSWVAAVKTHPEFSDAIKEGRAAILHGNIGPTREWGNPQDESNLKLWPNYIAAGWREWAKRKSLPDIVFIDGRYRVSCAFSVVVAFGRERHGDGPMVLMHDFLDERPAYRDVLKYYEIEQQEGSLVALKIRRESSSTEALADLLTRQFDFG